MLIYFTCDIIPWLSTVYNNYKIAEFEFLYMTFILAYIVVAVR